MTVKHWIAVWGIFFLCISTQAQVSGPLISSRLDAIQHEVELDYNGDVKDKVNAFLSKPDQTKAMLERFLSVDPAIRNVFIEYNVPPELRYLSLAASSCDPIFKDEEGRTGFYALRYNVGKRQGLRITNFVDERRDPVKSAAAFCKEIQALQNVYNDWKTALTVYYVGRLEWDRARSMAQDSTENFWTISRSLPEHSRSFYQHYVASTYLAEYYGRHNIVPAKIILDTAHVNLSREISFKQLSEKLDVDKEQLKLLNPIYKKEEVPMSTVTYSLVIPKHALEVFNALGDSLYIVPKDTTKPEVKPTPVVPQATHRTVYYTVRSGDVLSYIADYYDCYVSDIRRWNGLRSTTINVNQRLKIQVPAHKYDYYSRINGMTRSQKRQIAAKD